MKDQIAKVLVTIAVILNAIPLILSFGGIGLLILRKVLKVGSKELASVNVGGDGGRAVVAIDGPDFVLEARYPVAKLAEKIVDPLAAKLKALIPGDWDDAIIDKAIKDVLADLAAGQ